ncbi:MAG: uracil-DNA glycosylase [Planctomycetota bacterium]|nr:uracil-DNA glycosylase [Planctomycetota bacterium]
MDRDKRDEGAEPDPNEELLRLARGIRGHVKRRKRLGGALPGEVGTPGPAAKPAGPASGAGAKPPPAAGRPTAPLPTPKPGRPGARSEPRPTVGEGPARDAADVKAQAAAARDLDEVRRGVAQCTACELCATRTNTVFLDGKGHSGLMFVGEAPGAEEDKTGVPFVGRAGQLLTDIVTKGMGLDRRDVWIANVLKCRPPENRDPTPDEKATCTPWLDRQIELLEPRILVPLGRHASMHVLGITAAMNAMRGRVHTIAGRPVVPTFHPAYLLRNPADKKECWKDIQVAMQTAGIPIPKREAGPGSAP